MTLATLLREMLEASERKRGPDDPVTRSLRQQLRVEESGFSSAAQQFLSRVEKRPEPEDPDADRETDDVSWPEGYERI
jgi:hypothetical protein